MLRLFKRISQIGIGPAIAESEKKYIALTNAVALVAMISLLGQIPVTAMYWPATREFIGLLVIWAFVFQFVFWLNHFGHHLAAKVYLNAHALLFFGLFDYLIGPEGNVHFLSIFVMVVAFFIFLDREKFYMYLLVGLAAGCFLFFETLGLHLKAVLFLPEKFLQLNQLAMKITMFFTVSGFVFFISRILRDADKNLEIEKNKSDRLLLNILPEKVANELKEKGFYKKITY